MSNDERLFEVDQLDNWRTHWVDMPAFSSADETPFDSINVQFSNAEDRRRFLTLMGENPDRRRSIWYPSAGMIKQRATNQYDPTRTERNRYPIYVISKGRWERPLTARALEKLGINYRIVVEPQERDSYASTLPESKILTLPFSNLGLGSIPARNWVWEHARESGAARHWILDDNINAFYRLNNNIRTMIADENPFKSVEDFVDRYENIPMAGLQYRFLAPERSKLAPVRFNTRIYSCILLSNQESSEIDGGWCWRGRYNEDTDLSLRILKAG